MQEIVGAKRIIFQNPSQAFIVKKCFFGLFFSIENADPKRSLLTLEALIVAPENLFRSDIHLLLPVVAVN
jgi:hypothetical protein